jgi:hypothetical protein
MIINDNFVALVRELTIPTKRPPLVGEVSANYLWIPTALTLILYVFISFFHSF